MYNVSKALSVQLCTVNRSETRLLIVKCAYRLFPKFLPSFNLPNSLFYEALHKSQAMFTIFSMDVFSILYVALYC